MGHAGQGLDYIQDNTQKHHTSSHKTHSGQYRDYLQDITNWELTGTREIAKLGIQNWTMIR